MEFEIGEHDDRRLLNKNSNVVDQLLFVTGFSKPTTIFEIPLSLALNSLIIATFVLNHIASFSVISVVSSYFFLLLSTSFNFVLALVYAAWVWKFDLHSKSKNAIYLFHSRFLGFIF